MTLLAKPMEKDLIKKYVKYGDLIIEVCSNAIEYLTYVIPEEYVVDSISDNDRVYHRILFLYSSLISSDYVVYKDPTEEERRIGEHPNSLYTGAGMKIEEDLFPNHSIHIEDENNSFLIIGNKDIFVFYYKRYIKRIASKYYKEKGYTPVHAGLLVDKDANATMVVGESRTGKSTLCFNMSSDKVDLYNDDIMFAKSGIDGVDIKTIVMNPCMRKNALDYVVDRENVIKRSRYYSAYNETYYILRKCSVYGNLKLKNMIFIAKEEYEDGKEVVPYKFSSESEYYKKAMSQFNSALFTEEKEIAEEFYKVPAYEIHFLKDKIVDVKNLYDVITS